MQPITPRTLRRARAGSERATRDLWAACAPGLRAYLHTSLVGRDPNPADTADDLLQQVFLSIYTTPVARIRAVRDPAAWLTRCARNAAINHTRTTTRAHARTERVTRDARADHAAHADTSPSSSPGELAAAVAALALDHREVLILRHAAGLTFDQIAAATDTPRSTIATRHAAALRALHESLAADHAEQAPSAATAKHAVPNHPAPSHLSEVAP